MFVRTENCKVCGSMFRAEYNDEHEANHRPMVPVCSQECDEAMDSLPSYPAWTVEGL